MAKNLKALADPYCEICEGEGEYPVDVFNHDSHQWENGTGSERCMCTMPDEDDFEGEE